MFRMSHPKQFSLLSNRAIRFYAKPFKDTTYEKSKVWPSLSELDKKQTALISSDPDTAELAFYQGLAFKEFGEECVADAIWAFNQAIKLDVAGVFTDRAKKEIATLMALNVNKPKFSH